MTELIRLGSNENLLGPSPLALEAIQKAAAESHLYPTDHAVVLTEKLVARIGNGITADQIVLGNGSGDVLRMITHAYVLPNDEVIVPVPTFISYERQTEIHRGRVIGVPLKAYQIDLQGILDAVTPRTRLIFLCNPNNPTGQIITHDDLASFVAQVPSHVVVVVDEAYIDFVDAPDFPNVMELINAGHNMIATRTFSKVYGLASLRVGYGFGKQELVAHVRARWHPMGTGRMAYAGAAAALADEAHIVNTIELVKNGRKFFYQALDKLGVSYLQSQGFYVLLRDLPLDAQHIVDEAHKQGVILRHTDVFNMPNYVRISIGRPEDNQRAIEVLANILSG